MARLQVGRSGSDDNGGRVALPLLIVLVAHLFLMLTPLHEAMVSGHATPDAMPAGPVLHLTGADRLDPTQVESHFGSDCTIRATIPARSDLRLLVGLGVVGGPEVVPPEGLLRLSAERSTWHPPPSDRQVLFQVFRL